MTLVLGLVFASLGFSVVSLVIVLGGRRNRRNINRRLGINPE